MIALIRKSLLFSVFVGVIMTAFTMACEQPVSSEDVTVKPTPFTFYDIPLPTALPLNYDTSDFVTSSFPSTHSRIVSIEVSHPKSWSVTGPDDQGTIHLFQSGETEPAVTISEEGLIADHIGRPDATTYVSEARVVMLQKELADFRIIEVFSFPAGDRTAYLVRYTFNDGAGRQEVLESHIGSSVTLYVSAMIAANESDDYRKMIEAVVRGVKMRVNSNRLALP